MSFEPDTPTIATLIQRAFADIDAELGAETALDENAPEYVLGAVTAGLGHGCYATIKSVAKNIVPSAECDEAALLEHARMWLGNDDGRREASPASLPITGTGTTGTPIPAGTRFRASDGGLYETLEELIFETDNVVVQSIAVDGETGYGAEGNKVPGATLTLVDEVVGLDGEWTVDGDPADGAVGGGADQETLEELADRIEFAAQNPPSGGIGTDYERWAREVPGVGKSWAYARLRGPGTITVYFTRSDPDNPIPDAPLVALVQAHLDERAGLQVGSVLATAPIAYAIDPVIAIKPNTATSQAAASAAMREAIAFYRRPGDGSTYFDRSWLTQALSGAVGETGHTLTTPAADFTPPVGRLPVLGTPSYSTKA